MSPEAGKPETPTQAGSDKFVPGIHHPTDGVQAFNDAKGDLPDVGEALIKRGVPEASVIDPVTLEVPVDKIPVETEVTIAEDALVEQAPLQTQETTEPATSTPEEVSKRSKRGLLIGLGSAAAGVAVTAAAFFGFSGDKDSEAPKAEPSVSASPTPGESETAPTPSETEAPEAALSPTPLTVERYQDSESLTRAFVSEDNEWMMAGATLETKANEDITISREEYISNVTQPIDEAYIDAHYVSDWRERPDLVSEIEDKVRIHQGIINAYMGTVDSGEAEDEEPYEHGYNVTSVNVISDTGDERVVEYHYDRWDNSDKNRAEEFVTPTFSTPVPGGTRVTWVQEDGVWKISTSIPLGY